jgi:Fic family protein
MRERVIELFPDPALRGAAPEAYQRMMTDTYERDAYHSLSIEGYRVTPELIERVRGGRWNPEENPDHANDRDALAARGYWLAFQEVREAVGSILKRDGSPASIMRASHRSWYRALFEPAVGAGLVAAADLAGYRTRPVYIQASRHVPPSPERVRDAMPALFDLLEEEPEASVRAVLGHWLFGYVHPFPDGNGRVARLLMNAMLASGGYPWTVIRLEDRDDYMAALEAASVDQDIEPFAAFVADAVQRASG